MSESNQTTVKLESVIYIVLLSICVLLVASVYFYAHGRHNGRCLEMCRPSGFDSDQVVNGGCLCIGSDKVLRFKDNP